VTDIPAWRKRVLKTSIILVLVNPVFFIVALGLTSSFKYSNNIWGNLIFSGVLVGIVSLVCGLFGNGFHRWKVVATAFFEMMVWWFMAVGL
jgi:hypothetical protein